MIDINKLDDDVLECIAANLDLDADEEKLGAMLKQMSCAETFDSYCEWNGLIGWAHSLIRALDNIRAAEMNPAANVNSHEIAQV